tara:strand:+ start:138 stop:896 length:759 start_codon:yes stop_codon:yes gene_type:complete
MDLKLKNKNVLITGSSQGIGLEIAKYFIKENCKVVINSRKLSDLIKIKKKLKNISFFSGDVTNKKIAKKISHQFKKKVGNIDILVCNVGSGKVNKKLNQLDGDWEETFKKNFFSATNMIESFRNSLIKTKGCIICISSICGIEQIPGAPFSYSIAKNSLNTYIKHLSKLFGKHGVRINGVAPGNIIHKNSVWEKKIKENPKKIKDFLKNEVALKKFGKPSDVASLTVFLSSEVSNFITGSVVVIDGGQLRNV